MMGTPKAFTTCSNTSVAELGDRIDAWRSSSKRPYAQTHGKVVLATMDSNYMEQDTAISRDTAHTWCVGKLRLTAVPSISFEAALRQQLYLTVSRPMMYKMMPVIYIDFAIAWALSSSIRSHPTHLNVFYTTNTYAFQTRQGWSTDPPAPCRTRANDTPPRVCLLCSGALCSIVLFSACLHSGKLAHRGINYNLTQRRRKATCHRHLY